MYSGFNHINVKGHEMSVIESDEKFVVLKTSLDRPDIGECLKNGKPAIVYVHVTSSELGEMKGTYVASNAHIAFVNVIAGYMSGKFAKIYTILDGNALSITFETLG